MAVRRLVFPAERTRPVEFACQSTHKSRFRAKKHEIGFFVLRFMWYEVITLFCENLDNAASGENDESHDKLDP